MKWLGLLLVVLLSCRLSYSAPGSSHRVDVTVLSVESSIHTSLTNRNAYLVRVKPKRGKAFVAKVVDEYPGYMDSSPISPENGEAEMSVMLRRTPYCDDGVGPETDALRCFEVVHKSWRSHAHDAAADWWK
jgi:hypothetical protein